MGKPILQLVFKIMTNRAFQITFTVWWLMLFKPKIQLAVVIDKSNTTLESPCSSSGLQRSPQRHRKTK